MESTNVNSVDKIRKILRNSQKEQLEELLNSGLDVDTTDDVSK